MELSKLYNHEITDSAKQSTQDILIRVGLICSTLMVFLCFNLPTIKVIYTPLGAVSIASVLIWVSVAFFGVSLLGNGMKLSITLLDVAIYFLTLLVLINTRELNNIGYFIMIIFLPYLVGRGLNVLGFRERVKYFIICSSLVQSLLVLYTTFVNPLFSDYSNFRIASQSGNGIADAIISGRASGTIGHPVVLGALLLPGFVCSLQSVLIVQKKSTRVFNLIVLILVSTGIFLSYSRGTWIVFLGVGLLIILSKQNRSKVLIFTIVMLLVGLLGLTSVGQDVTNRFSRTSESDFSVSHRTYMYDWTQQQVSNNIKSFLFGYGFKGSQLQMFKNKPIDGFYTIDNLALSSFLDTGVIGSLLLILIIVLSVRYCISSDSSWISYSVLALFMNGMTFDAFYWEQTCIIFWLLVGISHTNKKQKSRFSGRDYVERS